MNEIKNKTPYLLIAGDIHSGAAAFRRLVELSTNPCCLAFLFTGDINLQNREIRSHIKKLKCDFIHVQGNHDSALGWDRLNLENPPLYKDIKIQNIRLFMSHGYVLETPEQYGLHSENYDLVITGHSHRVRLEQTQNTTFLNPGSAACPVDPDDPATYAILNLKNKTVEIRELWTDETLQQVSLK